MFEVIPEPKVMFEVIPVPRQSIGMSCAKCLCMAHCESSSTKEWITDLAVVIPARALRQLNT